MYRVEPLVDEQEQSLLLVELDQVPHYVFRILHVYFEQLDSFALVVNSAQHLVPDDFPQLLRPVTAAHHAAQDDLEHDQHVLVREEQQVLQLPVRALIQLVVHQQLVKLHDSNRKSFIFLRFE